MVKSISLSDVTLECPVPPSALTLGIWNNFDAVREKQNLPQPQHPWYFVKPPTCLLGPGQGGSAPPVLSGPGNLRGGAGSRYW